MKIILSTRNPSKATQIREIFPGPKFQILTLSDVDINGEAVENGATLKENARIKAFFAYEEIGKKEWVMADDTGLFISHLNGEPGVRSARWAGENASTEEITAFTLKKLEGALDRTATFETVVALISPGGRVYSFSGKVQGVILEAPKTKPQPKMPYSSIFVPNGTDKVWAEMTTEEENRLSHRGFAFRQVKSFLEDKC